MKEIYLMLTKTSSIVSRAIAARTKEEYVHASIIIDSCLTHGYSFSRRKIKNPFIGGFMKENYQEWIEYFKNPQCRIYRLLITDEQYEEINCIIQDFYSNKEMYKYDCLGLVAQALKIDYQREYRYFCTRYVAYVLGKAGALYINKPDLHVRGSDFHKHEKLQLIYEGQLEKVINTELSLISSNNLEVEEIAI